MSPSLLWWVLTDCCCWLCSSFVHLTHVMPEISCLFSLTCCLTNREPENKSHASQNSPRDRCVTLLLTLFSFHSIERIISLHLISWIRVSWPTTATGILSIPACQEEDDGKKKRRRPIQSNNSLLIPFFFPTDSWISKYNKKRNNILTTDSRQIFSRGEQV